MDFSTHSLNMFYNNKVYYFNFVNSNKVHKNLIIFSLLAFFNNNKNTNKYKQ